MDGPGPPRFPGAKRRGKIRVLNGVRFEGAETLPPRRGFDLLCLPIIEWGFRFQRPQQLLSQFARDGHRVFYLRTGFLGLDREPVIFPRTERVFEIGLPGEFDFDIYSRTLEGETLRQASDALGTVVRECGLEELVCLVQYPSWEPLARRLRERYGARLIYDCLDEHTGFGTHGPQTAADEQTLLAESDLVLVTSRPLLERVRRTRPDALRLPNAADTGHFGSLPPRAGSPLARLPRPVVGYYGAIAAWFDADAVALAAGRHADWSFVLIGDTKGAALEALADRSNVHRLGEVSYEELPSYVAAFDVCTIPFLRTPLTEATNPVKIYEYLATGKPVVARRLPELESFSEVVDLYDTPEEFVARLESVVSGGAGDAAAADRRRKIAAENTWAARYRTLRPRLDALPHPVGPPPGVEPRRDAARTEGELRDGIEARAKEIRRLDAMVQEQARGIEFLRAEIRSEIASRDRQLQEARERLDAALEEREKTVGLLNAEREKTVALLNEELHRVIMESDARRGHLEHAMRELERWESSRLGRLRRAVERAKALPGRGRRFIGRVSSPGTPLYSVGRKVIPPPVARWMRRVVAPVEKSDGLVTLPASADRRMDALPETPAGRYDVVVFSIIDWDFRFQRPQQIATQFGRHGHRVLYLSTTQFLAAGGPAWALARKGERVAELRIRAGRPLDIYRGRLDPEALDALVGAFDALAADLAMGDALCLVQIPFWAPLAERLRERLGWRIAYDCMDEWTNFPGFGPEVLALEDGLVRGADATVVSADRLLEKWNGVAPRLVLARNGIDGEHYRERYGPNEILGEVAHPVIGYYGALASWVDAPLLEKIARNHPEATIVLAGGQFDVDLSRIARLPNVRLLGQRPYAEMPQLLWSFDVCIIPFLVNDITEATNPVKFYEYLYGGKPVVAPALTELLRYADLSYLARGHEEFLSQLERALAEAPGDPRRAARRRVAEENDWARRYEAIHAGVSEAHPLVSIVVVTYGGLELTKACLESLLRRETWPRLEVIVVDNASADGTAEHLRSAAESDARVRFVANEENRGFAAANNQGIAMARGEIVILLNNDTVVPPGLVGRLEAHLRRDPSIGLLCPTTNFAGNEARVEPDYAEISGLPGYAARRAREFRGRVFDIGVAAMYCVASRRAVLDEVGPLDEAFGIGMFEDDDFAVRMRRAGYRVACAEDAYVHHVGQGAFRKLSPEEYDRLWKKNQAYFEKKWSVEWKPHTPREGVAAVSSKIGAE